MKRSSNVQHLLLVEALILITIAMRTSQGNLLRLIEISFGNN